MFGAGVGVDDGADDTEPSAVGTATAARGCRSAQQSVLEPQEAFSFYPSSFSFGGAAAAAAQKEMEKAEAYMIHRQQKPLGFGSSGRGRNSNSKVRVGRVMREPTEPAVAVRKAARKEVSRFERQQLRRQRIEVERNLTALYSESNAPPGHFAYGSRLALAHAHQRNDGLPVENITDDTKRGERGGGGAMRTGRREWAEDEGARANGFSVHLWGANDDGS